MAKRVRPPLVSFGMFLIVCSMAWVAYENRGLLSSGRDLGGLDTTTREQLQESIFTAFEQDSCFVGLRSGINWRPNEQRYRLDLEASDAEACEPRARELCEKVAQMIRQRTGAVATVTAYDSAGRELGRCVL